MGRMCRETCNHCTWPTMHERVASCAAWPVIFISMDPLLALRQCPVPLCGIAMRRDFCDGARLDAPIHRMRYIRAPRAPHHGVTTTLRPRARPHRRKGMPTCNVAGRSYDCRPKASSWAIHTPHTPVLFCSGPAWSPLPSPSPPLYLSKDTCPINGYNCKKRITAKPIRVD